MVIFVIALFGFFTLSTVTEAAKGEGVHCGEGAELVGLLVGEVAVDAVHDCCVVIIVVSLLVGCTFVDDDYRRCFCMLLGSGAVR